MLPTRLRRLPTFSYVGPYRYSLTLSAFERRALFTDSALVNTIVEQLLRGAESCGFEIVAYCFMPDHVHIFAQGASEDASLPTFVKQAKQLSGYHGKKIAGAKIWQTGYYERVVRDGEDTRVLVAYILDNPVRAGLVSAPGDYAFSGSGSCDLADLLDYVQLHG